MSRKSILEVSAKLSGAVCTNKTRRELQKFDETFTEGEFRRRYVCSFATFIPGTPGVPSQSTNSICEFLVFAVGWS